MNLRSLTEDDIPKVMRLYEKAIVPTWDGLGRDYDLPTIQRNMLSQIGKQNYHMIVATSGSSVTGYLAWEQHPDHTSKHVIAHLRMILTTPSQQRVGLASGMMESFEQSARVSGCTKVLFDVIVGSSALVFYDSRGYSHWSNYMEKVL